MHRTVAYLTVAALAIAATASATLATSITLITQFDYPSTGVSTEARGVADTGVIVGRLIFPGGAIAGFGRFPNGKFVELTDPAGEGTDTEPAGVNDVGVVDGYYKNAVTAAVIGFSLAKGIYTDFQGAPAT
jgi:hypothetical protein